MFPFTDTKDIDVAYTVGKVITVDRTKTPSTLQVKIGDTTPASGEIDESLTATHTGWVTFPDENNKKYNFWYYPTEGKIYWSADKGKTKDIWTGETDERSKNNVCFSTCSSSFDKNVMDIYRICTHLAVLLFKSSF